jgi:hypothetical protein
MSLIDMKTSFYWLVALLLISGCGPNTSESLDIGDSPFTGEVDPDLVHEGFYEMFDTFKAALIDKNWENLYSFLRIEERKYFPKAEVFVDYMAKGTRLWELSTFDVLSKKIDIYDGSKVEVEVYFHAEIIPGPTEHYGSIEFIKKKDEGWSVLNWELLRLPTIQFQK